MKDIDKELEEILTENFMHDSVDRQDIPPTVQAIKQLINQARIETLASVATLDESSHRENTPYLKVDSRKLLKEIEEGL